MARKIGEVLRQARQEAGLSIRDLERLTGMASAAISQVENGVRRDPGFSTVLRLARATGISLDDLVVRIEGRTTTSHLSSSRQIAKALSRLEKAKANSSRVAAQLEEAIASLNDAKKSAVKKR